MKKVLSVLVITLVSVSLLTACGQNTSRQGNNAADNAETMVDDAANTARSAVNSVTDAVTPDSNTANSANNNKGGQTSLEANPDTSNFVGEEKAKQIALDKAGIDNVIQYIENVYDNAYAKYYIPATLY